MVAEHIRVSSCGTRSEGLEGSWRAVEGCSYVRTVEATGKGTTTVAGRLHNGKITGNN